MKKLKPMGKRVLMKQDIVKTSAGGIIIPTTSGARAEMNTLTAEVVAVGPDATMFDEDDIGKSVHYGRYAAYLIVDMCSEDTEYLIINDYDILGVFE